MSKDTLLEVIQPAITNVHGAVTSMFIDVPVINFTEPTDETTVRLVMEASRDYGMFQIVNHEIPTEVIQKLQEVGKVFFELPQDEKDKYAKPADSKSVEGYGTKLVNEEIIQGWFEYLFHIIWPSSARNFQYWPQNPSIYREATEEYTMHLLEVVNKLLNTLSLGLGLKGHELKETLGGEELVHNLRIN